MKTNSQKNRVLAVCASWLCAISTPAAPPGTVVVWGSHLGGSTNVPPGVTNVTAIAAGASLSLALKSDGTIVAW